MNTILLISSDKTLLDRVGPLVQTSAACDAEVALAANAKVALDFLNTEMPDLVFINFSDPAIDSFGPSSHTLPTAGHARAYAGVSVDSFVRKATFQQITREGLERLGPTVVSMARAEGLDAHAQAVTVRLQ